MHVLVFELDIFKKFYLFLNFSILVFCLHMSVYTTRVQCLLRSEGDVRYPGTRISAWEPLMWVLGIKLQKIFQKFSLLYDVT